tara:strand:+ start:641 stop:871 length:231 start_codon:yes stop_codon:yes gene_type:complete
MGKNIHLIPFNNKWAVKKEGSKNIISRHRLKSSADKKARNLARKYKVELVIHKKNGVIQDKDSFGNDTFPPRDTVF